MRPSTLCREQDVLEAIAVLPWVKQLCPLMPHEYAHQSKADPLAYAVVEHMLTAATPTRTVPTSAATARPTATGTRRKTSDTG